MTKNVLALTFFLASFAFASGPGSQIVGRWHEVNGIDSIEFKADGTCAGVIIFGTSRAIRPVIGTYVTNGDTIKMTINGTAPMTLKVQVTADNLVVNYVDGGVVKYDHTTAKFQPIK
jgi:hypothetical protein